MNKYEKLIKSLTNIKPSENKIKRIEILRDSYKNIASSLFKNCKGFDNTRECSIAITKLEESLMWAVKSIVLEEEK